MERPSRRSSNGSTSKPTTTTTMTESSTSSSSRRRRREAADEAASKASTASQSDGGADTDSSSVVLETRSSSKKKRHAEEKESSGGKRSSRRREDTDDATAEEETPEAATPERDESSATTSHATDEHEDDDDEAEQESGSISSRRRDRSQSVVSTTSDTSSIVSELIDGDVHEQLYAEKLLELEKKKKMVEEGTLAEYCRRVAEFKDERNRLLQTAEWHKSLQLKNTQDLYGFEVQRAHDIWEDAKDELKASMLAKTDDLLLKLQTELEHLTKTGELVPKAQVVVNPSMTQPESPSPTSHKRRKVVPSSIPVPENVLRLPLDAISADLADIMQDRTQMASRLHTGLVTARLDLVVDRRRLICGTYVFEEGDEVVMTSAVLKQDFVGVISSVSDDEVYVVLSTGDKVRVLMEHIATRRCEIRPFLRGTPGITSLQSSGWVECEPF